MPPRLPRRFRQLGPEVVLGLVVLLSAVSLWQAWNLSRHLQSEAQQASRIYGRVIAALNDTAATAQTEALLDIVTEIRQTELPVVITDTAGRPTQTVNLPFDAPPEDPRVVAYIRRLDQSNPPIVVASLGEVHYGRLPIGQRLRLLGILQLALLVSAVAAGIWAYRTAVDRDRDRLWVAMARESAHQLGTPLMSAAAWVDRLLERDGYTGEIAGHLLADLDRLHRVAQRFERIGRPAHRDRVALGTLVERTVTYFEPRLPKHAHQVRFAVRAPGAGPFVTGDPVLLEWALEALVRNAIDALRGRGGTITLRLECSATRAYLAVHDDGPGVAPEVRTRLFEPGVTTKQGGWGIGLALARRIAEDMHDGRLTLAAPAAGTEFVLELPLAAG
ncbi:MAG: HAMP domain-containing histidine kinase [Gemmatimonadota bacterium]|nr:HAMP domain-containing histidine kinase [Gemmatimonadota bacterium]